MKQAYIFNAGCVRRALDSTKISHYLTENGWVFTNKISSADLIVVATCGTIKKLEDISVATIRKIVRKRTDSAKVIITGCLSKINPDKIRELGDDFELIPTRELERFDTVLNSKVKFKDVPDPNLVSNDLGFQDYVLAYRLFRNSYSIKLYIRLSTSRSFNRFCVFMGDTANLIKSKLGLATRQKIVPYYNLRIGQGCVFKCGYCAIRFATGRLKSKPIDQIVEEFKKGLKEGHTVFQLICEDTGCYGLDIGTTFPALLKRLLEIQGDYQILIIDFCGLWVVRYYDELVHLFQEHAGKVIELYVSLQSGSDKVLRAMKRPVETEDLIAKLKEIKAKFPDINLRTTVIIGYPGETDEDFMETIKAVKEVGFSEVQLNKYEDRPGTASSKMKDKIPQEVIDRRYKLINQYC